MERASRIMMFSSGRSHRTMPFSTAKDPEVTATLPGNLRDSPFEQAIPHPRPNLNTPKQHPCDAANCTRSDTDGPGTSLEPCPFRDPTDFRGWLTTSFTDHEREPIFRRVRTDADIKPAQTPNCRRDKKSSQMRCSSRTVDHGSPETKYDASANLKLASRIEERSTVAERQ